MAQLYQTITEITELMMHYPRSFLDLGEELIDQQRVTCRPMIGQRDSLGGQSPRLVVGFALGFFFAARFCWRSWERSFASFW